MRALGRLLSPHLKKQVLDLGVYGHSHYTPFVVLGRSRVGSNLLRGLLNSHPEIAAFGEIFRKEGSVDWDHTGYFASRRAQSLMNRDPVAFLRHRVLGRYPLGTRAVGFKLFYYHAKAGDAAEIWPYLQERHDVRIIHLKRRNILQTHLSRKRAALSGRWVDTANNPDATAAIHLDYDECVNDFSQTRAWEDEYDHFFASHQMLQVEYEHLAEAYAPEMQRIESFLGVSSRPVRPSTFRQTRQRLSEAIANYEDLKAKFTGTAWEDFFVE